MGHAQDDLNWPAVLMAALTEAEDGFRAAWAAVLPDWRDDDDPHLAQEMRWHAAVLHAMATWSAWYGEVFIPQGTVYEYGLGCAAAVRDHLQHALPLCWYDAPLAAAILRYTGKHTDPWGHIRKGEDGGIWFALNGPLVDALADRDAAAARELLERRTCRRHAATYPDRWIGMWSCGDSIHSRRRLRS